MVAKISIFGKVFLVKQSGWANLSGKFGAIVREGLATPKKSVILATPPPWYGNPNALSPAQRAVNAEFARIARATAGQPLRERIAQIKSQMKGRSFGGRRVRVRAPAPAPAVRPVTE